MEKIEEKINSQSIKHIAESGHKYLFSLIILPVITFSVVYQGVSLWLTIPWLSASLLVAAFRYYLVFNVRRIADEDLNASYWGKLLTLSSFASGCLWGLAALLFLVPDSLGVQLYILLVVFSLTSMTMILYSYWMSAYYAFVIPSLLGAFFGLVSEGSTEYYAFSLLTIMYGVVVIQVARNQQLLVSDSLRLRFKNADLLDELQAQKESADAANISKSQFLAAASHDLRQPLHSIGLFSAALANRSTEEAGREFIDNIDSSVASLDMLLNSLLDISKLDAGVVSPQLEHIDLDSVIEGLSMEYLPRAAAKELGWQADRSGLVVYSDSGLLNTVLRNLISNAIRYTDSGSVTITCQHGSDGVDVKIADTGVGIPIARQKEIFKEFFQLSNPDRDSAKGAGLGLAIVDRLAPLLNIDIQLISTPGLGSEFILHIPQGDRRLMKKARPIQEVIPHDGAGFVVLVIDNHQEVRSGMKALLKSWHYSVLCVRNEAKALRAMSLAKVIPDVVLVDYQLDDGVTGVEVLKSLTRQLIAPFDAIILTGDTSRACMLHAHESGYKVLHKPVLPGKLRAMLINFKLKMARV